MTTKKWLKSSFILVLLMTFIIGFFNYIIDPFHQYRVETFYPISFTHKLQRYINPGFAKNYDYNSVILGSSMSENFIISNVKDILKFKKPIKLCINGTSAYEESLTLRTALKHKEIKNVIYGLDTFLFWGEAERIRHGEETFPFFLYDDNIFNDYKYIFSLDTTIKSIKTMVSFFLDDLTTIKYDFNKMYRQEDAIYSKKIVMQKWSKREESDLAYQPDNTFSFYKKSFNCNFLNIFKQNPKVNFIIYYPPVSILTHKYEQEKGVFEDRLRLKKYIFESTKDLSNVHIYDFQIANEITHNLDNYKDLNHFHPKINKWILERIKYGDFKVDENKINSILDIHENQVNKYKIKEGNK